MGEQHYVCAMKDSDAFVVASTLDVYYVMSIIGKDTKRPEIKVRIHVMER